MTYEEFETLWERDLHNELASLEHLRRTERVALISGAVAGIVAAALFGYFIPPLAFVGGALVGWGVYNLTRPKEYKKIYKEKIISSLIRRTRYEWKYLASKHVTKDRGQRFHFSTMVKTMYENSGLYFIGTTTFNVDDLFESHNSGSMHMAEIKAVRGRGKGKQTIFQGLFFAFDLKRPFQGETYIRSEKDSKKEFFGGYDMGTKDSKKIGLGKIQSANLEWNEFERLLDVKTNNEIEAREILTPDFMVILYEWWHMHKKHVRLSFKNNHLYVAIPFEKDLFEPNAFSSIESHKKELWSYLDATLLAENLFVHIEHKYRIDLDRQFNNSTNQ